MHLTTINQHSSLVLVVESIEKHVGQPRGLVWVKVVELVLTTSYLNLLLLFPSCFIMSNKNLREFSLFQSAVSVIEEVADLHYDEEKDSIVSVKIMHSVNLKSMQVYIFLLLRLI